MLAEAQRVSILRAMGIDVYALRRAGSAAAHAPAEPDTRPVGGEQRLIVVCARTARGALARFAAQLPRALGVATDAVRWRDAEEFSGEEPTAAYLAIGASAARAIGAQLPTALQERTLIATSAEPPQLLDGAAAKRVLWQVLRPIARRLAEGQA